MSFSYEFFKDGMLVSPRALRKKIKLFHSNIRIYCINYKQFKLESDDSENRGREEHKMAPDLKYYFNHEIRVISYLLDFMPFEIRFHI